MTPVLYKLQPADKTVSHEETMRTSETENEEKCIICTARYSLDSPKSHFTTTVSLLR